MEILLQTQYPAGLTRETKFCQPPVMDVQLCSACLSKQDLRDTEGSSCPVELWVAQEMLGLRFSEDEPLESHPRNIEGFIFSKADL